MYISTCLQYASMSSNLKGFLYLCDAIELALKDQSKLLHITKTLYPELAKKYHVSPKQVERSIRYAIRVCINKCHPIFSMNLSILKTRFLQTQNSFQHLYTTLKNKNMKKTPIQKNMSLSILNHD